FRARWPRRRHIDCCEWCRRTGEAFASMEEWFNHTALGGHNMKHRVLIADDEEHARSGLATLVSGWGYEIEEAADGTEALERAAEFHPGVVIADVVMPGLDGMGLLKSLAEVEPAAAVILLTGHATGDNAASATQEGA